MIWNIRIVATTALDRSWYCNLSKNSFDIFKAAADYLQRGRGLCEGCVRYCAGHAGSN